MTLTSPLSARAGLPDIPAASAPPGGWAERAFTWVGGAVDAAVVAAMQLVIDRLLVGSPGDIERVRASAAPFLAGVPTESESGVSDAARTKRRPRTTEIYLGPLEDGIRMSREIALRPGDPIQVEHWLHSSGHTRATVICVHGFAMGYPWLDARALFAHDWFAAGLDVALYTLPHHGARARDDSRFSGDRFATADVGEMNRAVGQAVEELELLIEAIRFETEGPVGLVGLSLGGTLAALMATRDPDLDFVVSIAPPACFGDLAWRFFSRGRTASEIESSALTCDELRQAFRWNSPLSYPLAVPRERVMLVAGRGDRIVPPEHPLALWQHWSEPALHWYSGSHLAPFGRRGVFEAIRAHLERLGIP